MQLLPFLQELFLSFLVIRIRYTTVYRADVYTLGSIEIANALGTFVGINFINRLSLRDGFVLTLRFTGTTTDTLIRDFVSHIYFLLDNSHSGDILRALHFGSQGYFNNLR
jgi:hypothetical protein